MKPVEPFDPLGSSLEGTHLIEASAGTGKTYTIACLYLRLILEKELSPEQILVVTFTEAATKELRDRIRKKLRAAVDAFAGGGLKDDFLSRLASLFSTKRDASERLIAALRDFDQAAIYTIHGFCQRMLHENAFESGSLFDTELITDQEHLKREIIEDFWRRHFYTAPFAVIRYALGKNYQPQTLLAGLETGRAIPGVKVIPPVSPPSADSVDLPLGELCGALDELQQHWPKSRQAVYDKLLDPALSATTYKRTDKRDEESGRTEREIKVRQLVEAMDSYLAAQNAVLPLPLFDGFQLVTPEKLTAATKKNQKTPTHPVFDLCQTIWERAEQVTQALDQYLLSLKATGLKYLNDELPIRKQKQNIQHFDDLLNRVKQGLEEPGGEELAAAVRERYRAALIDEFQDTDPVQYAIFHNLFRGGQGALFLIGDPKQAIYSFRGADLFTYMKASRHVDRIATLTTNWRSQPGLIHAVNTLFGAASNPFVYQDIAFHPASPSSDTEADPLLINGRPEPPLKLWFLGVDQVEGAKRPIPKPQVQTLLRRAVAAEISRLLELASKQQALIGEMPLKASDIAILVRTNEEARRMQQDLAVLKIPAVLYSTEDVFDSHEAMEMERILTGIILSHREGLVRAALATDIMGRGGDDLAALLADEKLWEKAIVSFRGYFELWHEQGFMRMFRHLMLQEKVRSRLLSCPDGERRVTNVLHLSEILHQEAWERKLGLNELLKWFAEQRNPQLRRGQETQLRLESDENAVKVVTIHKSKGLEYPVVFCPFAWGSSRRKDDKSPFTFHDASHDWALTLDLGSPEREGNRVMAEKETLAENVRLLYVALTRAKKRCYLAWGPFNTAETSAPAYLFHHRGGAESLNPVVETAAAFKELDDSSMLERLREIERLSAGSVELAHLPLGPGKKVTSSMSEAGVLSCRKFHASIDTSWRVSSFSSLVSDAAQTAELPDRDESDRPTSADVEAIDPALPGRKADIFSFPRGAKAGTLLHDILEHLDFAESDPRVMENLVVEKLNEYGFDRAWQGAVCAMLDRVLAVPLGVNGEAFSLSSIAGGDRLNELEFYCALKPITPASLQKLFSRCPEKSPPLLKGGEGGFSSPAAAALVRQPSSNQSIGNLFPWVAEKFPEHLGRLNFHPTRGFMRGFVDLVFRYGGRFYLVDWKSNHLGNSIGDYHQEALVQAMLRDYYLLQYHLYTVALDRYLALRLPDYRYDRDFGGIFYIFLRGVDPVAGARYGVYRDRPPQELIAALVAGLIA